MKKNDAEILILITQFETPFSNEKWELLLKEIPENLQLKVKEYKQWRDYHASLLGNLLLKKGIQLSNLSVDLLKDVKYSEKEKPFISEDFFYNISHSGKYIICAISLQNEIGVDVEKYRKIDFSLFNRFFTEKEWYEINNHQNPNSAFFEMWSLKESAIKADGRGTIILSETEKMDSEKIICDKKTWFYKKLNLDAGYAGFVCSKNKIENLKIIAFDF